MASQPRVNVQQTHELALESADRLLRKIIEQVDDGTLLPQDIGTAAIRLINHYGDKGTVSKTRTKSKTPGVDPFFPNAKTQSNPSQGDSNTSKKAKAERQATAAAKADDKPKSFADAISDKTIATPEQDSSKIEQASAHATDEYTTNTIGPIDNTQATD